LIQGQKKIDENVAAFRADPAHAAVLVATNNRLKVSQEEAKALLEDFKKLPDFAPALLSRYATCYSQMDRNWEALVAYNELLQRYPNDSSREAALFGSITASAEIGWQAKAQEFGEKYLKEFNDGPNASAVGYLLGATALQANDLTGAESYFGRMLNEQPKSNYREEMRFLLANSRFAQTRYDDAVADYQHYGVEFPNGSHQEEATYRIALCSIFSGKYEDALKRFSDYLKAYPAGDFIADAKYRMAVCLFAASQYDEVITDCKAWEDQFQKGQLLGEVLALKGDALAAKEEPDEALSAYLRSYEAASRDEVVNYSLFAAQKLLQKKGDWNGIGQLFERFVKEHPKHPAFVLGVYWIGKARAHEGKIEEAKAFIAETIKRTIADPNQDAVEQLLTQLAQLCARKKPAHANPVAVAESGSGVATATPSPVPQADPGAELDSLLGGVTLKDSPTAQARVLYAKAEMARLRKQPAEMEKGLEVISEQFKPEDLSPMLLAITGDYLLEKNRTEKAVLFFERLRKEYPKCDMLDFAYNGLAETAFRKGDYQAALQLYSDAIDKAAASTKLKDVTVGRAKTLMALGRMDEAKQEFEQVAATREWRGEATAFSVYSIGEIAQKRGDLPGAIAVYQRVYVGYQRFLPWVAKAYLKSGECFEKLGKTQEALNTYREMLQNGKLSSFKEFELAKKRLSDLGAGGQGS
jgi:TolA-binding protein